MKLPNFRLYETQATASLMAGVACVVSLLCLSYVVFRNFDAQAGVISYNSEAGMGQYRPSLVTLGSVISGGLGALAAILGYSSLGQKRNTTQGRSALGLILGAIAVGLTPVLFYAWRMMSEAIIQKATTT
jgi:hypothetical protein